MGSGSVIFVVAVAVVVLGGALVGLGRARARSRTALEEARELAGGDASLEDPAARFVGRTSAGRGARGAGALVLGTGRLGWVMTSPRRSWTVERSRIVGAERCVRFGDETFHRPLLRIDHLDDDGGTDASAWEVTDPDAWVRALSVPVQANRTSDSMEPTDGRPGDPIPEEPQ